MNARGPVALIVFLSFAAAAIGVHVAVVSCVSLAASHVSIILSMDGLGRPDESTAMVIGFGLMAMIPTAILTGLAIGLGHALRGKQPGRETDGQRRIDRPSTPSESVDMALMRIGIRKAVSAKCPACGCRLAATQGPSASDGVPDMAIACLCGARTGAHPSHRPRN